MLKWNRFLTRINRIDELLNNNYDAIDDVICHKLIIKWYLTDAVRFDLTSIIFLKRTDKPENQKLIRVQVHFKKN
jgi:hypothetical protein